MDRPFVALGVVLVAALAAGAAPLPSACTSCDAIPTGGGSPKARILFATAATEGRVDAFCILPNGRFGSERQSVDGFVSPRRLVVDQANHRLYVGEQDNVTAFRIGPNGGLTRLWRFPSGKDLDTKAFKNTRLEIEDLALSSDCSTLYVPGEKPGRILAVSGLDVPDPADPSHALPPTITSCAQGPVKPVYHNAIVDDDVLYVSGAGSNGRIDTFRLGPSGVLPGTWSSVDGGDCRAGTEKCTGPHGKCAACGNTGQKPCSPECSASICPIPRPVVTTPDSTRRKLSKPLAFQIVDSPPGAPDERFLYVAERGRKQMLGFRLGADGLFRDDTRDGTTPQKPFTRLHTPNVYLDLVTVPSADPEIGATLVGSQYNDGRLDSFVLSSPAGPTVPAGECHLYGTGEPNVCLPKGLTSSTGTDLRLAPVRMVRCRDANDNDWIYSALGLRDRVEAIRLTQKGAFDAATREETPQKKNSFPNDVAIAVLDGNCQ
jgi:hypothetical protein